MGGTLQQGSRALFALFALLVKTCISEGPLTLSMLWRRSQFTFKQTNKGTLKQKRHAYSNQSFLGSLFRFTGPKGEPLIGRSFAPEERYFETTTGATHQKPDYTVAEKATSPTIPVPCPSFGFTALMQARGWNMCLDLPYCLLFEKETNG